VKGEISETHLRRKRGVKKKMGGQKGGTKKRLTWKKRKGHRGGSQGLRGGGKTKRVQREPKQKEPRRKIGAGSKVEKRKKKRVKSGTSKRKVASERV